MKKNGYTLAELLGVLIILAALFLMAFQNIGDLTNRSRDDLYNVQIKTIKDSAQIFVTDFLSILPTKKEEQVTLELKVLKDLDIIDQEIRNPITNAYFSDNTLITLTCKGSSYEVEVYPEDSEQIEKSSKYKDHIVLFRGGAKYVNEAENRKDNFLVVSLDGKVYSPSAYEVEILSKEVVDSVYTKITYQVNIEEKNYILSRMESCQSTVCE